jgi:RNA polymerase sigma-70 factor (ECF subfamily)
MPAGAAVMDATESELRKRALTGDREALGALLDRHVPRIRAAVRSAGVAPEETEDVVQEALARALVRWTEIRSEGALGAWLATVARNAAVDWIRRRRREAEHVGAAPWDACGGAAGAADPRAPECVAPNLDAPQIPGVTADEIEILRMRYADRLTGPEIAARLGLSLEAAKKRLQRARASALGGLRRAGP